MLTYDPFVALANIDANSSLIFACLAVALTLSFVYFGIALNMAKTQRVYVEPFLATAIFFWHDLTFVLNYNEWHQLYGGHWWLQLWSYGLVGTVILEAYLIWQFIKYGHNEILPIVSKFTFSLITLGGLLGAGAMWYMIKSSLNDPLYFLAFAITAVWSVPFHTALMLKRGNSKGQSIAMNLAVMGIFIAISCVVLTAVPAFLTPTYYAFFAIFFVWPLFNIWLIKKFNNKENYSAL